jgi:hypothetical protein
MILASNKNMPEMGYPKNRFQYKYARKSVMFFSVWGQDSKAKVTLINLLFLSTSQNTHTVTSRARASDNSRTRLWEVQLGRGASQPRSM